jgi:hypothetical protein
MLVLIIVGLLALAGVVATVRTLWTDGYRRIGTRPGE